MTDVLSQEEIRELTRASDLHGARAVAVTWSLIAASFVAVAVWPNVLTVVAALIVLGGRQLALAVLMHDASHRSLFAHRGINDFAGRWLCGAPVWSHLDRYRRHHLRHHAHAGSTTDPDLALVSPFPTTRRSLVRKLSRDLLGVTGAKRMFGLVLMDLGLVTYTIAGDAKRVAGPHRASQLLRRCAKNLGPMLLTNLMLAAALLAAGHLELYLLWVGAYVTTFSLFLRVRSMAEHACTDMDEDPRRHTRTTRAGWLARLTVAPHHVNYHLEHHLLMTAPLHRLPEIHALLRERGALEHAHLSPGYRDVLRRVSAG